MRLTIDRVHAFTDNYIWMISNGSSCYAVDPGEAAPVLAYLAATGLHLEGILVTHWHGDHQGGVPSLLEHAPNIPVIGSGKSLTCGSEPVREGDRIEVLGAEFDVLEVPGHTLDHVAYVSTSALFANPVAFTGDTMFVAGCGRLFEGSAEQMYDSLHKIDRYPETTAVYCAHEYTLSNLQFAVTAEPGNIAMQERLQAVKALRERDEPTVPSTLQLERETNPFLRSKSASELAIRRQQKDQF